MENCRRHLSNAELTESRQMLNVQTFIMVVEVTEKHVTFKNKNLYLSVLLNNASCFICIEIFKNNLKASIAGANAYLDIL